MSGEGGFLCLSAHTKHDDARQSVSSEATVYSSRRGDQTQLHRLRVNQTPSRLKHEADSQHQIRVLTPQSYMTIVNTARMHSRGLASTKQTLTILYLNMVFLRLTFIL